MYQDGKADIPPSDLSTGKIMLTLVDKISDTLSGYHHTIIALPPSYEAACAQAKKAFAKQIGGYTETVDLRQAAQRKDGQYIWSIIPEDGWKTCLARSGEEIGVFLTEMGREKPDRIPYNCPKRLVWFQIGNDSARATLQVVRSYKDCVARLEEMKKSNGWTGHMGLRYDRRMVGCEADRKAYREHDISSPYPTNVWAALDDPAVFEHLVNLYHQPLRIQVRG